MRLDPLSIKVGRELHIEYFDELYAVKVEAVGCVGLYDPEKGRQKS